MYVHSLFAVGSLFCPGFLLNLDTTDAIYLEDLVVAIVKVIRTNINIVGGESIWLDMTISDCVGIPGLVILQDDFLLASGRCGQGLHMGGVAPAVNEIRDGGLVVDDGEFSLMLFLSAFVGAKASSRELMRYDSSSLKYISLAKSGILCGTDSIL